MSNTKSAKDYLSQAYYVDRRVSSMMEQIRSLRSLAEKVTVTLSDMSVDGTRSTHRNEDVIMRIVCMEAEISATIDRLIKLKRGVISIIKRVNSPDLAMLLELRYLCFMTWEQIAVELHFDLRWVHRLHNRALSEVEAIRHC